ncbi:uncharacterized protein LOC131648572 [Vicia villosa]|uniref:uncharacterized protein LOC131648572 n=1 Tax=Vicia villosa TaxID=3911 RepID=UPI00273C9CD6|nr:uncharacterized protein LOC131648572 [Vicia villosa]
MAPYEALYGRKCRSPLCWSKVGEKGILGPEIIQETTEKVKIIRDKMKQAQDRQKSYADKRRRPLEFDVGDHVFLKLRKFVPDLFHPILPDTIEVEPDLSFQPKPCRILEYASKSLRSKEIPLVKAMYVWGVIDLELELLSDISAVCDTDLDGVNLLQISEEQVAD